MLDSFKNDPPIFRHLIFPSFDWKDLIASKWKFTLASEKRLPSRHPAGLEVNIGLLTIAGISSHVPNLGLPGCYGVLFLR